MGDRRSLRSFVSNILLAGVALASFSYVARAQTGGTGLISGTVTDSTTAPVPNVNVLVSRSDGAYNRRAITSDRGSFRVAQLPPGAYNVTVQRIDFYQATRRDVAVQGNRSVVVNFTLTPRTIALPEISVKSAAPVGEQRAAEVGITRVDAEAIRALPVGTDVDRIIAMVPGARGTSLWGAAGTQANSYQLDGVSINNPGVGGAFTQPSIRWIQRMEIKGLGANAEDGNYQGGLINVITKSGDDTRHASFESSIESQSLNGSNLTATSLVPEIAGRRQVIAQLSGPILRDRLFYYTGAEVVRGDFRAIDHLGADTSALTPFQQVHTDSKLFGKLTFTPDENDLFNLSVTRNDQAIEHADLTGRETANATTELGAPTSVVNASWQHLFGATTLELKGIGFDGREQRSPYAGDDIPGIYTYQLTTQRYYQNSALRTDRHARSLGGTATIARYFHGYGQEHHVKVGGEHSDATWTDQRFRNGGMTWRPRYSFIDHSADTFDPTNALTWQTATPTTWGGEADLATHTVNSAAFVQDEITIGMVSLFPGLRYGHWRGDLDPTARGVTRRTEVLSSSGIDGRFGITVDIPDSLTPVRLAAHVGRYHQSAFAELFDRAAGANAYSDQQVWEYYGPPFADPKHVITLAERDALAAQGTMRLIENVSLSQSGPVVNYKQPYIDQFSAGMEVRFGERHWRGEFLFVSRDNKNLVSIVDRNIATNFTKFDYVYVSDRRGEPVLDSYGKPLILPAVYLPNSAINALVALANANPDQSYPLPPGVSRRDPPRPDAPDYVITNPPDARRRLRQWQLNFDAEYDKWSGSLSAAFSGLTGNFSSVSGYDALSIGGFEGISGRGPGPYVRPNEAIFYDGDLENNSFLTLKARMIADLPWHFKGGVIAEYISGDRKSPQFIVVPPAYTFRVGGTTELFPILTQAISRERFYTRPQGVDHYEGHYTLDVHLEREFETLGATWNVLADGFNVLNSGEITLANTQLSSNGDPNALTKYGTPLARQAPRQLRIGAGVTW